MRNRHGRVLFRPSEELAYLPEGLIEVPEGFLKLPTQFDHLRRMFVWICIQYGRDSEQGSLIFFDPDTLAWIEIELPGRPGFVRPTNKPNTFVLGMDQSVYVIEVNLDERKVREISRDSLPGARRGELVNDSIVFDCGGVSYGLIGTKNFVLEKGNAGLYPWRPGKAGPSLLAATCSNGKTVFDRGDGIVTLLETDSPTGLVSQYRYNPETGELRRERTVVDMTAEEGNVPDGHVVTPDFNSLLVATFNFGATTSRDGEVRQYSIASGDRLAVYHFPGSPRTTIPLLSKNPFTGQNELFVLSADEAMPESTRRANPNAGCLFVVETDIPGKPVEYVFNL